MNHVVGLIPLEQEKARNNSDQNPFTNIVIFKLSRKIAFHFEGKEDILSRHEINFVDRYSN